MLTIAASSSSDDNDESPKNKKRKVSSTDVDRGNVRGSGLNFGQREKKLLKPSFEPSNARERLVRTVLASTLKPSLNALNYHSSLTDDHKMHSQGAGNQSKKTPPFIGSVTRKTRTKSSISGPSVKPYVSKREREKLTKENALITASRISANYQLEEIGCHNSLEGVVSKSVLKTETTNFKTTCADLQCRPPKKLHLNLKGHSQGVNCVRWNSVKSNLLISASMDHAVCVKQSKIPDGVCVDHKS